VPAMARAHMGLYVYRRDTLLKLAALPAVPLELIESLEQLRAMANGIRIRVVDTSHMTIAVDTPADLERVRSAFARDVKEASYGGSRSVEAPNALLWSVGGPHET
jgi:CMP-2-keto-3-deoxyoctulosonic acid synthetase